MDEMLDQFLIEGRELVAQASDDFARLLRYPQDAAAIDSAFRAIHTLKGSVAIFALAPAERVLHAAEDVLERARKGSTRLDRETVTALVACLDAVDRWIDRIEAGGKLGGDADRSAAELVRLLPGNDADAPSEAEQPPEWLTSLMTREAATLSGASETLVAFRYVPDADCFFRGDDPFAIVAGIPDLITLAILPGGGGWPELQAIEPFTCFSVLEGVSAAALDQVKAAFRLVPDQVMLHPLAAPAEQDPDNGREKAAATLRVAAARVDALGERLSELIVAVNAFAPLAAQADRVDAALAASIRAAQVDLEQATSDLHRGVASVRLVPLAPTLRRLPRLVREIAASLQKQVEFSMAGEGLEVDKEIADGLFEPLLHLVRNALDHGIEAAERRQELGKPAVGRLALSAGREGDAVIVTLSDDGSGIDPARICEVAVARGLLSAEDAEALSESAALRLIFAPGFSTAGAVTDVSGRGVGMDAVLSAVERMRGHIDIDSRLGSGTRFRMRLPVNALTTRLLVVAVGTDRYGVALDQVVETVRIDSRSLMPVGEGLACVLRGRTVPVLSLAALLGLADVPAPATRLLVTRSGGERVALKVDGFAERIDALVRPPDGMLAAVRGVSGSTVTSDGGVLLVLNLPELAA
ncbi:chemotaxis protein CheA [Altericroceibacterium xinjiangense]|uniref:chemotaxis protein CheA n=1 Tax=Altericroceibacterium xinjiangense TaxID=762261 RepID=UPI000F7F4605|nr:chemotaxis protein CheA [Altericroceibacterium xinjiangense]